MDLASVRTLARDASFNTLGVDATITRPYPDDAPIQTRAIWMMAVMDDNPIGADLHRTEPRHALAFRRDQVPTVPRGSIVLAASPEGGAVQRWRVDGPDRETSRMRLNDTAQTRVIVVADPEPS